MMDPESWTSRTVKVQFTGEDDPDSDVSRVRKFTKIRRDATVDQLKRFGRSVSKLTPNGDDPALVFVTDHFAV